MFKKATIEEVRLRLAILGASGSGKTFSSLSIATNLVPNGRIALIDSEHGSASRYAKYFNFDVCNLEDFSLQTYISTIEEADRLNYDVIIVDSLSHAWYYELDQSSSSKNSYTAWKPLRVLERKLIDLMLQTKAHFIGTMRTKTEYILEKNSRGKMEPHKVGTTAIQKQGIEYEFDVVGELDLEHTMRITKTRFMELDNKIFPAPGANLASEIIAALAVPISNGNNGNVGNASNNKHHPEVPEWYEKGIAYYEKQGVPRKTIEDVAIAIIQRNGNKLNFKEAMDDIIRVQAQGKI